MKQWREKDGKTFPMTTTTRTLLLTLTLVVTLASAQDTSNHKAAEEKFRKVAGRCRSGTLSECHNMYV